MSITILDGIPIRVEQADLNKDGIVGGVEVVRQSFDSGVTHIQQNTELGDSLKELNQDNVEQSTRMSGIDMRARLHPLEISSILALDSLVALGVCPHKCLSFTRQKKRLSVSEDGKGRTEIVEIVAGKKEQEAKSGFGGFVDRFKSSLGVGNNG